MRVMTETDSGTATAPVRLSPGDPAPGDPPPGPPAAAPAPPAPPVTVQDAERVGDVVQGGLFVPVTVG